MTTKTLPQDIGLIPWAAERLGISATTAYKAARRGELVGCFKVGSQYRIYKPTFEAHYFGAAA